MDQEQNKLLRKISALVFGLIFFSVAILIGLTFFVPQPKMNSTEKIINQPVTKVWQAIYNRRYYLQTKKEIIKYTIYDSFTPKWVEYYTPSDSVENETKTIIPKTKFTYLTINKKHQQINGFSYRLDSISENQTKVKVYEFSRYFNVWGSIFFQLFHPKTVIDYEQTKLNNTLKYIDSLAQN